MSQQEVVTEDLTAVVGRTLKRAKRIIFEIPQLVKDKRKDYRDAAYWELRNRRKTLRTIKDSMSMIFDPQTKTETIPSLVTVVRDLQPIASDYDRQAREKGAAHLQRLEELKAEKKVEVEEIAKDFASEVITALLQ